MKKLIKGIFNFLTLQHSRAKLSTDQTTFFRKEKYKWFFSSIVMGVFPFFLLFLIGISTKTNPFEFVNNGELILVSFMIIPSLLLDFIELKESNHTVTLLASLNILILISQVSLFMIIKLVNIDIAYVSIISSTTYLGSLVFANYTKSSMLIMISNKREVKNSD